ncbi:MAG: PilZ domain-containing protein [Phycisphaerales bacterium]
MTKLGEADSSGSNKRKKGRVRAELLSTSLGRAVDLSETGARLERRGAYDLEPGATVLIALSSPQRQLSCPARVIWVRKTGWFTWQIGLEFLDQSETFRRSLRELSMACMDMRTLSADSEELAREAS